MKLLIKVVGILLLISAVLAGFVTLFAGFLYIRPRQIIGVSMYPAFHGDEYLLTTTRISEIERGMIVVYKKPNSVSSDLIHRVVGLPGEEVFITDGEIYINGDILDESDYLSEDVKTIGGSRIKTDELYLIEDGHYLLLGDNRSRALDSRYVGTVPEGNILSIPIMCYWNCN